MKNIILNKILPIISYILILASFILQYLSKKRMGVQRDLAYRNEEITSTILTPNLLCLYKWIIVLSLILLLIIIIRKVMKNKSVIFKNSLIYYTTLTLGLGLINIIMIIRFDSASLLAYPIILLSMLIALIVQYIRLIKTLTKKGNDI